MILSYPLLKKNSLTIYYSQFITLNSSKCQFLIKNIEDLEDVILYLEFAILWP